MNPRWFSSTKPSPQPSNMWTAGTEHRLEPFRWCFQTHLTLAEADGTVGENAGVVGLSLHQPTVGRDDHRPATLALHHTGLELRDVSRFDRRRRDDAFVLQLCQT